MTASEKLDMIRNGVADGRTVFIASYGRIVKVTPRTFATWEASGRPLFKVTGDSLYMARGKQYDCIDYCGITA